jgi:three-Cys-motif partner protein
MTEFNERFNKNCHRNCDRDQRKTTTDEDICLITRSVIDDLPVRCVGEWSRSKIFLLTQYFGIFSTGMKGKWDGNINYIEICSGPGRCVERSTGMEIDGTSLCVVNHKAFKYLKYAFFFDSNIDVVTTLNSRIENFNINNAKAYAGDYNQPDKICEIILTQVNQYSLNLIFIDPTDCSLPFSMIESLRKRLPHVDFIVNVAVGTDFNRNILQVLLKPDSFKEVTKKYLNFLGNSAYFENPRIKQLAVERDSLGLRNAFREEYINSLRGIGYQYFGQRQVKHYYDIVFASSDPKGIDFWEKATKNEYDGQRTLDLF